LGPVLVNPNLLADLHGTVSRSLAFPSHLIGTCPSTYGAPFLGDDDLLRAYELTLELRLAVFEHQLDRLA
jgi:hypothetical protein